MGGVGVSVVGWGFSWLKYWCGKSRVSFSRPSKESQAKKFIHSFMLPVRLPVNLGHQTNSYWLIRIAIGSKGRCSSPDKLLDFEWWFSKQHDLTGFQFFYFCLRQSKACLLHIDTHTHVRIHTHARTHIYIYIHTYIHAYTYINTLTYIHTYIHTRRSFNK